MNTNRTIWAIAILVAVLAATQIVVRPTNSDVLDGVDGAKINLMAQDQEYTLLFFWQPGCQYALDDLRTLHDQAESIEHEYDVRIITVGLGAIRDDVPEWVTLLTALAPESYKETSGITLTPTTLILHNGALVSSKSGSDTDFEVLMRLAALGEDYGPDVPIDLIEELQEATP
jgi:hypothetical protein